MGAHRSSLREDSQVSSAALAFDIINGNGIHLLSQNPKNVYIHIRTPLAGDLVHLDKDEKNDTWLAATTSLGLFGVIARVKIAIVADFKVYANQTILHEDEVLNGDIYEQVKPYVTANYWVLVARPEEIPSPYIRSRPNQPYRKRLPINILCHTHRSHPRPRPPQQRTEPKLPQLYHRDNLLRSLELSKLPRSYPLSLLHPILHY
ncbi:hypothetical protein H0H93_015301 [Arthromyces matolae]|nr:hypothetical protein H0H93_015301 [Arthromyces matolae]